MTHLRDIIHAERPAIEATLAALVRAAAHGHDGVQDLVAARLRAAGAAVRDVTYDPSLIRVGFELGVPSHLTQGRYVIGTLGDAGDGLLLWAHSDSEPLDPRGWTHPPFAADVVDRRMIGWGIGDDLVGLALLLAVAELHARHGLLGAANVGFASVPSKKRAQAIIHLLDGGYRARGSVYLHPAESGSGLGEIKAVASGLLRFQIVVPGAPPKTSEPTHTPFLHTAVDPVALAAELVLALRDFGDERAERVHFAPAHAAIGRSTNVHVGAFHAGAPERPSKVPDHAALQVSLTFPPNERLADVRSEVEAALDRFALRHPWLQVHPLEVTWKVGIQGAITDFDSPLYRRTHDAITATTGVAPFVNVLHAASDIRNPILHAGIPTVGIGPRVGDLTVSGGVDEWADLDDFVRAVEVVVRIASAQGA